MRAVAAHVQEGGAPPPELRELWDWHFYGLPPNPGGLRDQPVRWVRRLRPVALVYRAFLAYQQAEPGKLAQWKAQHPTEARIIAQIQKDE
jgi:hypothetical protein